MALRVLLADESSTIKKVMQLALQDFGVEVKSVPIGLDVVLVAKSFQPDLIFADVMLAKKSGYEVSADIKADSELKNIPVVLMWSGFMDLDEAKVKLAQANRRLEKPFDAEHLRSIVKELVPRLKDNLISNYLSFPDLPEIVETPRPEPVVAKAPSPQPPPPLSGREFSPPAPPEDFEKQFPPQKPPPLDSNLIPEFQSPLDDSEESDEFQQIPLPGSRSKSVLDHAPPAPEESWRQGGLEQFRVAPESLSLEEISDQEMDLGPTSLAMTDGHDNVTLDQLEDLSELHAPISSRTAFSSSNQTNPFQSLDPVRAEEILRQMAREVLENIAWKIIPDMTERIVREELQKLMKEAERLS